LFFHLSPLRYIYMFLVIALFKLIGLVLHVLACQILITNKKYT
jgi:hypothetical protein